jgi:hypothetical protein
MSYLAYIASLCHLPFVGTAVTGIAGRIAHPVPVPERTSDAEPGSSVILDADESIDMGPFHYEGPCRLTALPLFRSGVPCVGPSGRPLVTIACERLDND